MEVKTTSKSIEIRKTTFNKFEFNIHSNGEDIEDGKASISMNLPDRENGQEEQLILIKMEISYPDNQYQASAEFNADYSVMVPDLPEDISKDNGFQQAKFLQ